MQLFNRRIRRMNTLVKRCVVYFVCAVCIGYMFPSFQSAAFADELVEYKVKAAFIYNFIAFTQWPEEMQSLNLCVYGEDYFRGELDKLQSKPVNGQQIKVKRIGSTEQLKDCQIIFFSKSVRAQILSLLDQIKNEPILTLADYPKAITQGIVIDMSVSNERIVFEINLREARNSNLNISSRLLQLAIEVHQ